ncbi:hypothetical protein GCM10023318_46390 [Nocardia callitridis]|uniref:Uncharacterized protein n=1 Tax=Nocardia callitridis TaxID=648753 RepID=A0ABP9KNF6_9NOCA
MLAAAFSGAVIAGASAALACGAGPSSIVAAIVVTATPVCAAQRRILALTTWPETPKSVAPEGVAAAAWGDLLGADTTVEALMSVTLR